MLDNGKPLKVARVADVPLAVDLFRYMAGWATKIEGNTIPISGKFLAYTLRQPVGVVGQIIPWNFPLLMAAWKLGPALATGCMRSDQAGGADAAFLPASGRTGPGSRHSRWSGEHCPGLRRNRGRCPGGAS